MKNDDDLMIPLYKRLLEITEKEQIEIANRNVCRMENYGSLKADIIEKLEKLNKGGSWSSCEEKSEEIRLIIKKIMAANKINIDTVRDMQEALLKDISSLHDNKKAVRAYQAG